MKRFRRCKRGQFVIIAALLIAIMMISISPLLHEAATYYAYEPWDEYLGLIGDLELNFDRLVQLSLSNYTRNTANSGVLTSNLNQWESDLKQIYAGKGMLVSYDQSSLTADWHKKSSFSRAQSDLKLNVSSIGLRGYEYSSVVSLNVEIIKVDSQSNTISLTVWRENDVPIKDLTSSNFRITSVPAVSFNVSKHYDPSYTMVYDLKCSPSVPSSADLTLIDHRGIEVIARYP